MIFIGDMLRNGCILSIGPLHPVTADGLFFMRLLVFFMMIFLSLFIRLLSIVEMRLFGVGGVGLGRTLWSGLIAGFDRIWFLLHPINGVILALPLVDLVFWRILRGLMKNSVKLGFPIFVALGDGSQLKGIL